MNLHGLTCGAGSGALGGETRFVQFLHLLGSYPEVVAWDRLWFDGYQDLQKRVYGTVKFLAPNVQVGWHIWHHNSFSPLHRSQMDFSEVAEFADFIKPVLYNNCAGYRLHHHIEAVGKALFPGVDDQTLFNLYQGVLGYNEDVPFADLPALGLSPGYVLRETRRAVRAVAGRAAFTPGWTSTCRRLLM